MPAGRSDIADFTYFTAIARHRSFRRAGVELGVTASALSHALKGLEERLGVRLLHRTNRSVTLTAAGEELLDAIGAPLAAIDQAVERLNRFRDTPAGRIRLNVPQSAATFLLGPVLPVFAERYPEIEVDMVVTNRMVDVIGSGFDAGIRYGGTVPEDMIVQRLSADVRWVVAAAPAYLARFSVPRSIDDLHDHRCVRLRAGDDRVYRWDFEDNGREFDVAVPGSITVDDTHANLALALNGAGLCFGPAFMFASHLAAGELQLVLEDFATTGPGFHLYYSSRRQVPTGLRLLAELIREMRPLGL
jgi:DNA-binding transcriptional LysR family regulator